MQPSPAAACPQGSAGTCHPFARLPPDRQQPHHLQGQLASHSQQACQQEAGLRQVLWQSVVAQQKHMPHQNWRQCKGWSGAAGLLLAGEIYPESA